MIPMIARIRIVRETGRNLRLWIPLFLLWIVLLPFVLLVLPFICIALWIKHVNPFRVLAMFWQLFASVSGTHIETADGRESVMVSIY